MHQRADIGLQLRRDPAGPRPADRRPAGLPASAARVTRRRRHGSPPPDAGAAHRSAPWRAATGWRWPEPMLSRRIEIDDRRRVERQPLRTSRPPTIAMAERAAQFRSRAAPQRDRHPPEQRGKGRHHNRTVIARSGRFDPAIGICRRTRVHGDVDSHDAGVAYEANPAGDPRSAALGQIMMTTFAALFGGCRSRWRRRGIELRRPLASRSSAACSSPMADALTRRRSSSLSRPAEPLLGAKRQHVAARHGAERCAAPASGGGLPWRRRRVTPCR